MIEVPCTEVGKHDEGNTKGLRKIEEKGERLEQDRERRQRFVGKMRGWSKIEREDKRFVGKMRGWSKIEREDKRFVGKMRGWSKIEREDKRFVGKMRGWSKIEREDKGLWER